MRILDRKETTLWNWSDEGAMDLVRYGTPLDQNQSILEPLCTYRWNKGKNGLRDYVAEKGRLLVFVWQGCG